MGKRKSFYVQRPQMKGNFDSHQYFMGSPRSKPAEPPMDPKQKIALQKLMVGHFIEKVPESCSKKVIYIMQGDGLYEQRINKLGTFTTRIAKVNIPGLEQNLNEGWQLNVPKIPASLLGTTVSFFRRIYAEHSSEVFLQFYWNTENNEYIIHCPKQTVGGASVKYDNDEMFSDQNKILVFEIHSHGNMGAFFSSTDDGDEKADRFFGVVGNISNYFPDLKIRVSIGGNKVDVSVEDLFDLDEEMYHAETYPKDWAERIKKAKVQIVRTSGQHFRRDRQIELWGNEDPKMMDLVSQFENQDHLYSQYECFKETEESSGSDLSNGYYVQEGDDLWYIVDGKRYLVEDEIEEEKPEHKQTEKFCGENFDPYDWRKTRF